MKNWENTFKILDVLIDDVIDTYEHKAGLIMLEDMRDRISKAITKRRQSYNNEQRRRNNETNR